MNSISAFSNNITEISQALSDPNLLITQDLEIISKKSWSFTILSLLQPVVKYFGIDLLAYVRADNVAHSIFNKYKELYNEHIDTFDLELNLLVKIKGEIVDVLAQKTGSIALKNLSQQIIPSPLKWPDISQIGVGKHERPLFKPEMHRIESLYNDYVIEKNLNNQSLIVECCEEDEKEQTVRKFGLYQQLGNTIAPWKEEQIPCYLTLLHINNKENEPPHLFLISDKEVNIIKKDHTRSLGNEPFFYCYDLTEGKTYFSKTISMDQFDEIKKQKDGPELVAYETLNRNEVDIIVEKFGNPLPFSRTLKFRRKKSIMKEFLRQKQYDIWTLGKIFLQLFGLDIPEKLDRYKKMYDVTHTTEYKKSKNQDQITIEARVSSILNNDEIFTKLKPKERKAFNKVIKPMLQVNPEKRITAEEAKKRLDDISSKKVSFKEIECSIGEVKLTKPEKKQQSETYFQMEEDNPFLRPPSNPW